MHNLPDAGLQVRFCGQEGWWISWTRGTWFDMMDMFDTVEINHMIDAVGINVMKDMLGRGEICLCRKLRTFTV